jgi:hypothetical protein
MIDTGAKHGRDKAEFRGWKLPLRISEDEALGEARERKPRLSDDRVQRRATVHLTKLLLKTKWSRKEIRRLLLDMRRKEITWELAFSILGIGK